MLGKRDAELSRALIVQFLSNQQSDWSKRPSQNSFNKMNVPKTQYCHWQWSQKHFAGCSVFNSRRVNCEDVPSYGWKIMIGHRDILIKPLPQSIRHQILLKMSKEKSNHYQILSVVCSCWMFQMLQSQRVTPEKHFLFSCVFVVMHHYTHKHPQTLFTLTNSSFSIHYRWSFWLWNSYTIYKRVFSNINKW